MERAMPIVAPNVLTQYNQATVLSFLARVRRRRHASVTETVVAPMQNVAGSNTSVAMIRLTERATNDLLSPTSGPMKCGTISGRRGMKLAL